MECTEALTRNDSFLLVAAVDSPFCSADLELLLGQTKVRTLLPALDSEYWQHAAYGALGRNCLSGALQAVSGANEPTFELTDLGRELVAEIPLSTELVDILRGISEHAS